MTKEEELRFLLAVGRHVRRAHEEMEPAVRQLKKAEEFAYITERADAALVLLDCVLDLLAGSMPDLTEA
ncbi:hypothetical protein [Longispora albida]|uniref:hypothetical protein n=1 Tax=Longispora albida TaxID=203523 RepID=UPI000368D40F|nr:hypothetical protein [Longispora albida]